MGQSINRVTLVGNLTRDPEVKELPSGTTVAELGIAVNDRRKVDGDWTDVTSFFDVTVFGHTAEACGKYLSRGKPVAVDGKLEQQRWESSEGQKRSKVKIIANQVQFLGGRDDQEAPGVPVDSSDFASF